jgi:hypothetical protein
MSYYRGVVRDENGNTLPNASIRVTDTATVGTNITLYSDPELATATSNPLTAGSDGSFEFYAEPQVVNIIVSYTGFNTPTLSNVVIGQPFAAVRASASGGAALSTSFQAIDEAWGSLALATVYANGFTLNTDGNLVYSGPAKVHAIVTCTLSFRNTAADEIFFRLTKDDVQIGEEWEHFVSDANVNETVSFQAITTLETGEDIGLEVKAAAATPTFTVYEELITIHTLF